MNCKYYETLLDVCGLCDTRSDMCDFTASPSGQVRGVCTDPEDTDCSYYEEEE